MCVRMFASPVVRVQTCRRVGVWDVMKITRIQFGERGGTRTLDPMIKSHVLYHLSYALTRAAV
jgi:hypothetical protein